MLSCGLGNSPSRLGGASIVFVSRGCFHPAQLHKLTRVAIALGAVINEREVWIRCQCIHIRCAFFKSLLPQVCVVPERGAYRFIKARQKLEMKNSGLEVVESRLI